MSKSNTNNGGCSLTFLEYYVDNITFKINSEFELIKKTNIDYDISSKIEIESENNAKIFLTIQLFKNVPLEQKPFEMELTVCGRFKISNIKDKMLLEQNTIAILFPFARAIISTYTANANVAPLILPPINVVAYLNNKYKKETQESED